MSMLDGVSQCWGLGKDCVVWWEAWAAIGTFTAALVALWIADRDRRQRNADKDNNALVAFISLWPRFHRAQGLTSSIASKLQSAELVAVDEKGQELLVEVEVLERELAAIASTTGILETQRALRVTAAVALAGYVARQARRLVGPGQLTFRANLWKTCSAQWVEDANSATQQLLDLSVESEKKGNSVTGRRADLAIDH